MSNRREPASRQSEQRRGRRWVVTFVACALPVAVVGALDVAGYLAIRDIEVVGTSATDPQELIDMSGVRLGESWLRVPTGTATALVAEHPRVESARVRRTGGFGIEMSVTERIPAMVVTRAGGSAQDVLMDRSGVIIGRGGLAGLPTVVLSRPPPSPGGSAGDDAALLNAYRVWMAMSGPLRSDVEQLDAAAEDRLELTLRSGVVVVFGRAERIDEKLRAIGAVLADIGDRAVLSIDVQAPSRPVVRVTPEDEALDAEPNGSEMESGS